MCLFAHLSKSEIPKMFPSLSEAWRESPPHLYRPHSEHGLQARVWGLWACCLWSGSEYSQQSPGWSLSPWPTSRQWESHPRTAGTGTWSYCTDPEINVTASWQRQRSTQHAQIQVRSCYLWTPGYRGVIVHAQPAAHSVPEDCDHVPLTNDDATLTDYLSGSRSTIKPGGGRDQKSEISNFP